ncbi:MAG: GNAT family N-acetyltransferase [Acidobacteriota bacterium]
MLDEHQISRAADVCAPSLPQDLGCETSTRATPFMAGATGALGSDRCASEGSSVRFRTLRFPERLADIVELRRVAYTAAGKLGPDVEESIEVEMADPRNLRAVLVVAEEEEQIVGSVRLTPPLPGPLFHSTCRFDGPVQGLPSRSDFLESAWACIHPSQQGQGLFWHLVAHMVLAAKRLGKPYLVGGTAENLWPNWRRCGYRKLGSRYIGALSATELSVVILKVEEVLAGRNIASQLARSLALHVRS